MALRCKLGIHKWVETKRDGRECGYAWCFVLFLKCELCPKTVMDMYADPNCPEHYDFFAHLQTRGM